LIKSGICTDIHLNIDPITQMKFLKSIDDIDFTMSVEKEILAHEKTDRYI